MFFFLCYRSFQRRILGNDTIFFEPFDTPNFPSNWKKPKDPKYNGNYQVKTLAHPTTIPYEKALVLLTRKKNYILTSKVENFPKLYGKQFVLQYEARFPQYIDCTAGYIKLFGDVEPIIINEKTSPLITFGPEICNRKSEIVFKINHLNKKTEKWTEITLKDPPKFKSDGLNHLFTLVINPDNTYQILVDGNITKSGNLHNDFDPPVNGYRRIPDPSHVKPKDWDEREYIPDSNAVKPDYWDENAPYFILDDGNQKCENCLPNEDLYILDESIKKPLNWNDELYGEFLIPKVKNPKCADKMCGKQYPQYVENPNYRGKWKRPIIKNPNYRGKWQQRMIDNPDYAVDPDPYLFGRPGAIGFVLWTADGGIAFKNVLMSNDFSSVKNTTIADFAKRKETQLKGQAEKEEKILEDLERQNIIKRIDKEQKSHPKKKKNMFQKFVDKLTVKVFPHAERLINN